MHKSYLLFLYAVSLYITLNAWYKEGHSGIPDPTVVGPATYVFALLLLLSNVLEGLPAILGTALTFMLYLRAHGQNPPPSKLNTKPTTIKPNAKLKLGANK